MEYTVGSLSDLITGKNTPNKPKIIQKEFKPVEKIETAVSKKVSPKKRKKADSTRSNAASPKKRKRDNSINKNESPIIASVNSEKKKTKKPKLKLKKIVKNAEVSETIDGNADQTVDEPKPKKQKLSKGVNNAERRVKNKVDDENKNNPLNTERTIFVGNVSIKATKKQLTQFFKKYGPLESVRIRGISVADPKTPKKIAAIKKEFHPDRQTVCAYVRFVNNDDAIKAEEANGTIFLDNHLRVNSCESKDKPDETKAIFIGNLSFDTEDEELWQLFESCGSISYVRIVRDSRTGMGKGFGYVNFKESDAVHLALEMENVTLRNRVLRISLCNNRMAKKKKKVTKPGKSKFRPRSRFGKKDGDNSTPKQTNNVGANAKFQGSKFNEKKKKKFVNKDKKKLVKQLTAPSKKPQKIE